jgi:alpha-beta hydrolase superfamily lysophospholipase
MPNLIELTFISDGYRLAGTLHLPDQPHPPFIIGCHGLLADRHSPKQLSLARACNRVGIAYFRFDHRGCGDSQGDFNAVTNLSARCRDLDEAIATLRLHPDLGPLLGLFGSSFGGTVVINLAAEQTIPALVTFAAPIESTSIRRSAVDIEDETNTLDDALRFSIVDKLGSISNILIGHGQNDEIVPLEHAHRIYDLARAPKKLIIQEGGDHRMSNPIHQHTFAEQFVAWFQSYRR